jgi:hypothetical protein
MKIKIDIFRRKTMKSQLFFVGIIVLLISSCATSMTPIEVNNILPTLTESKFISQAQADEDIRTGRCKYLVKGRKYTAPIGLTVNDDLRNGAKGIDEWVKIDGGNAYVLTNFNWVTVAIDPKTSAQTTQLYMEFDTLLYE